MHDNFTLKDVDHIAIIVSDFQLTKEFYSRILNLEERVQDEKELFMCNANESVYITFFGRNSQDHQDIDLCGVNHIAFTVDFNSFIMALNLLQEKLNNFKSEFAIKPEPNYPRCDVREFLFLQGTYCLYFTDHECNVLELNVADKDLSDEQRRIIRGYEFFRKV